MVKQNIKLKLSQNKDHHKRVLTLEEKTSIIKYRYAHPTISLRQIAEKYHTCHRTITRLLKKFESTGAVDNLKQTGRPLAVKLNKK